MNKIKKLLIGLTSSVAVTIVPIVAISCGSTLPPKISEDRYVYDKSNNYYKTLDGLSGEKLAEELRRIQIEHAIQQKHKYSELPKFYSEFFRDKYFDNDNSIVDVYNEVNGRDPHVWPEYKGIFKGKKEGEGLNREHIIPQSWFARQNPARNDLHFVWPSDAFVNEKHGTTWYGDVTGRVQWTSKNGSKLGFNSEKEVVFEPNDIMKGDIARAYFYFALTYVGFPGMSTDLGNSIFKYDGITKIEPHYLETYRKWNNFDTVDKYNIYQNNDIAKVEKGLRNPFIDYPHLIDNLLGPNPKPFVNKGVLVSVRDEK